MTYWDMNQRNITILRPIRYYRYHLQNESWICFSIAVKKCQLFHHAWWKLDEKGALANESQFQFLINDTYWRDWAIITWKLNYYAVYLNMQRAKRNPYHKTSVRSLRAVKSKKAQCLNSRICCNQIQCNRQFTHQYFQRFSKLRQSKMLAHRPNPGNDLLNRA